jgi:DNA primase
VQSWRLGFAEHEWRSLHDVLKGKGYADVDIERSGLIKKAESRYYDRFRGRIMFPLKDASGRVIAFSGRLFEEKKTVAPDGDTTEHDAPKYLNSPETPIFRKSAVLYGLDRAKGSIRKSDFSIVVEGQMDLLMMHQIGFVNTVATSGTSLTEEHLRILKRFSDNVVLAMDGDRAGFQSALRGAELALRLGMNIKVAMFPESKDPAEVAKENPAEAKRIIKESQHVIDFLSEDIQKRGYDERKYRLTIQKEVLPFIQLLENRIDREHFIQRVSHRLNISEDAVREELKKMPVLSHGAPVVPHEARVDEVREPVGDQVRTRLVGLLLIEEGKEDRAIDTVALRATLEKYGTIPSLEEMKGELEALLFETERLYEEEGLLKEEASELVKVLEQAYIKATYQDKLRELRKAEAVRDENEIARLLKECSELSKELEKLKTPQ